MTRTTAYVSHRASNSNSMPSIQLPRQVAVSFAPLLFPAALAAGPAELRLAEETAATLLSNALHVFHPALAAGVPVVTPQVRA
jgi:hypothetical protein